MYVLRRLAFLCLSVLLVSSDACAQQVGRPGGVNTDSTGTELNDTANHWAKVGVLNQLQLQGFTYTRISTLTNTSLKTSPGVLGGIVINTPGAASNTITIKDAVAADCSGGTTIGIINFGSGALGTVLAPVTLIYQAATVNGLCITTATGTVADIVVMWR